MPEFTEEMIHIWQDFVALRGRVSPGLDGPARFTWQDLQSFWSVHRRPPLAPWKLQLLCDLDDAYLEAYRKRPSKPGVVPTFSAEIFDGIADPLWNARKKIRNMEK